jgi:hypothetical protein
LGFGNEQALAQADGLCGEVNKMLVAIMTKLRK